MLWLIQHNTIHFNVNRRNNIWLHQHSTFNIQHPQGFPFLILFCFLWATWLLTMDHHVYILANNFNDMNEKNDKKKETILDVIRYRVYLFVIMKVYKPLINLTVLFLYIYSFSISNNTFFHLTFITQFDENKTYFKL